jgi:hypothetical protein
MMELISSNAVGHALSSLMSDSIQVEEKERRKEKGRMKELRRDPPRQATS